MHSWTGTVIVIVGPKVFASGSFYLMPYIKKILDFSVY